MQYCSYKKKEKFLIQNIEMLDGQRMKQVEESGYKYLGITQENEIKA